MMRKIKILSVLGFMLLLGACSESDGSVGNESVERETAGIVATERADGAVETTEAGDELSSSDEAVVSMDMPYSLVWSGPGVELIDFSTGESRGTFMADGGGMIWNFFPFDNGYFGLVVEYGFEGGNTIGVDADGNFAVSDGSGSENSQDEAGLRFYILNDELTVVEDLEITNEELQDAMVRFGMDVVFEGGQLVIYYPTYWVRAAWGYDEHQSIRRYHIHTGITEDVFDILDETLVLREVRRVMPERIAFTGGVLHNETGALRYGFVDLTTGETTVFEESAFPINSNDKLHVVGSTVLIREELAPPTMGVPSGVSVLRGEVVVFNVITGENHVMQLDGLESHWAVLSADGNYVITVCPSLSYLKKYEISSGQLVAQQGIDLPGERVVNIVPLPDGQFGVRSATVDGIVHFELVSLS